MVSVPRAWVCDEEHTCICVPRPAAGSSCAEIGLVWKSFFCVFSRFIVASSIIQFLITVPSVESPDALLDFFLKTCPEILGKSLATWTAMLLNRNTLSSPFFIGSLFKYQFLKNHVP